MENRQLPLWGNVYNPRIRDYQRILAGVVLPKTTKLELPRPIDETALPDLPGHDEAPGDVFDTDI